MPGQAQQPSRISAHFRHQRAFASRRCRSGNSLVERALKLQMAQQDAGFTAGCVSERLSLPGDTKIIRTTNSAVARYP